MISRAGGEAIVADALDSIQNDRPKTGVFISYAHEDEEFAKRLRNSLIKIGYNAFIDREDILPAEPWRVRLEELIAAAEAVVVIVSPDWVKSPDCQQEVNQSLELKKHLAPLYWRWKPTLATPLPLADRNFISFDNSDRSGVTDADAFAASLGLLDKALKLPELLWVREHTKWVSRAAEWDRAGRRGDMLLPAGEIAAMEAWSRLKSDTAPDFPQVLVGYFQESSSKVERDRLRLRRLAGRAFVAPAEQALASGRHELALRLAAAGATTAEDVEFELVPELWPIVARSVFEGRTNAVLRGHEDAVYGASFSPDGLRIVTCGRDRTALVWRADRGDKLLTLKGHENSVFSVQFSRDNSRILTASANSTARIWDATTGTELVVMRGHSGILKSATFNADNSRVLTVSDARGDDHSIRVWDARSGKQLAMQSSNTAINCAMWNPDGIHVAGSFHLDQEVRIWNTATGKATMLAGHAESVADVQFSPDGHLLATASWDNTARIWDWMEGRSLTVLKHQNWVNSVVFSPNNRLLVTTSSDDIAHIWDVASGDELVRLPEAESGWSHVTFSPDSGRIATIPTFENAVHLWDTQTGACCGVLHGHDRYGKKFQTWIHGLEFSPDGKSLVTAGEDRTGRVWDAKRSNEQLALRHPVYIWSARFSTDGSRILTACKEDTVHVWNAESGEEISCLSAAVFPTWKTAFCPDGARLAIPDNAHCVRVHDSFSGEAIAVLKGHTSYIETVEFSPDGSRILTSALDLTARIWDAASGETLAVMAGHEGSIAGATFSPDGRWVATWSGNALLKNVPTDRTVRLWDAETGRQVSVLLHEDHVLGVAFSSFKSLVVRVKEQPPRVWINILSTPESFVFDGLEGEVTSASFSPGGSWVLTLSSDGTARLWSIEKRRQFAVLDCGSEPIQTAAFSPDGLRVVTTGKHTRVWDLGSSAVIAILKSPSRVANARFSPDGRFVLTSHDADDKCVRLWDVSRTAAMVADRALFLIAALERGVGQYNDSERSDLLLADAPDHLNVEAALQLAATGSKRASEFLSVVDKLMEPFHPNCYLSPSEFAEHFGLPQVDNAATLDKAASQPDAT